MRTNLYKCKELLARQIWMLGARRRYKQWLNYFKRTKMTNLRAIQIPNFESTSCCTSVYLSRNERSKQHEEKQMQHWKFGNRKVQINLLYMNSCKDVGQQ